MTALYYYPVTPFQGVEVLEVTADKVKFLWNDYGQKIGRIRTAAIREKHGEKVFRTYNLTIPLSGCRKIEGSC